MQIAWRIAGFGMAVVVGLLAWNLVVHVFLINTVASPSAQAEGEFFKMERAAQAARTEMPTALATSRYANEQASKELAAAGSQEERAFKAAQIFIGFYLVNTRGAPSSARSRKSTLRISSMSSRASTACNTIGRWGCSKPRA
jgi:hypothetical protein